MDRARDIDISILKIDITISICCALTTRVFFFSFYFFYLEKREVHPIRIRDKSVRIHFVVPCTTYTLVLLYNAENDGEVSRREKHTPTVIDVSPSLGKANANPACRRAIDTTFASIRVTARQFSKRLNLMKFETKSTEKRSDNGKNI